MTKRISRVSMQSRQEPRAREQQIESAASVQPNFFDARPVYEGGVHNALRAVADTCHENGLPFAFSVVYARKQGEEGDWPQAEGESKGQSTGGTPSQSISERFSLAGMVGGQLLHMPVEQLVAAAMMDETFAEAVEDGFFRWMAVAVGIKNMDDLLPDEGDEKEAAAAFMASTMRCALAHMVVMDWRERASERLQNLVADAKLGVDMAQAALEMRLDELFQEFMQKAAAPGGNDDSKV